MLLADEVIEYGFCLLRCVGRDWHVSTFRGDATIRSLLEQQQMSSRCLIFSLGHSTLFFYDLARFGEGFGRSCERHRCGQP